MAIQRGILCLRSVTEADMGISDIATAVVLAVHFTVEVGGQQSAEQLALVEQVDKTHLGVAGRFKICCAPLDFGIPAPVIEPHIEAYVVRALHTIGGFTAAEMKNKAFEMELRVPIEFSVGTGPIH
jgi:hypothetical protein